MVLVGLALLVVWLIVTLFTVELLKAILITAVLFIVLGLVLGERPFLNK